MVPLAVQANALDRDVAARSWQLWPFLIIGGGVGLLLRRTPLDFAGGLIAAATLGLMLGGLFAVGTDLSGLGRSCGGDSGTAFPATQGTLSNRRVRLEFTCGDLTVGTRSEGGWALTGTSNNGALPRIDSSPDRLIIRSREANVGFLSFGNRDAWTVTLPQDPTVDVDIQLNAGSGTLSLAGAHLGTLDFQGNAGSVNVDLGAVAAVQRVQVEVNAGSARITLPAASLTGDFQVNAGSIAFCVPQGTGLRITAADNLTASNNFAEQGLAQSGNTWESSNYQSAPAGSPSQPRPTQDPSPSTPRTAADERSHLPVGRRPDHRRGGRRPGGTVARRSVPGANSLGDHCHPHRRPCSLAVHRDGARCPQGSSR